MKTLQNNFTTPEQSMRLLVLGVPADSADGFYSRESYRGGKWEYPKLFESDKDKVDFKSVYEGGVSMYLPLFTVSRLMDIAHICSGSNFSFDKELEEVNKFKEVHKCDTIIEAVIMCIEDAYSVGIMDFSKLEN